jgi:uncharacterized membrane protein YsdA (DUF1294 family)/cold shock CspA family protein
MRHAGRITGWNDDKGFGFVTQHDGGSRAFVHIKAFQAAMRRPVEGDLVSYATRPDAKGRLNAVEVRFAGQRMDAQKPVRSKPRARMPRALIGAGFLAVAIVLMLIDRVPVLLPLVYLLMSGATWIAYAVDKNAAGKRGRRRTPESTLHIMGLLGGWPGGLIAQQQLRHKSVKSSFHRAFWLSVIVNLACFAALWHSGLAAKLTDAVIG